MLMHITRDPDSGVVDQDCKPLSPDLVWLGVCHAVKNEITFMGQPHTYWQDLVADAAQSLADEADPYEFDEWSVRSYER